MSVVNEFDCKGFQVVTEEKTVKMTGLDGGQYTFKYDIACKADLDLDEVTFYFNTSELKMLIVLLKRSRAIPSKYASCSCALMKYWVNSNDRPVGCSEWLFNQDEILRGIKNNFQEQYAAILIDKAINA